MKTNIVLCLCSFFGLRKADAARCDDVEHLNSKVTHLPASASNIVLVPSWV